MLAEPSQTVWNSRNCKYCKKGEEDYHLGDVVEEGEDDHTDDAASTITQHTAVVLGTICLEKIFSLNWVPNLRLLSIMFS